MKEAYRYIDENTDKFWRIECEGNFLVVNYGKTNSTGKYQLKEFANIDECEKEAKKLIDSKVKKGYKLYLDFPYDNHLYFDDDEIGIHPLTSHPNFRKAFTDEFYYNCTEEASPFGSDDGSDTLYTIYNDIRKNEHLDFTNLSKKLVEKFFGMKYVNPENISNTIDQLKKCKNGELNFIDTDMVTYFDFNTSLMVTYATAFAQIKITGRIDEKLKVTALHSIPAIANESFDWDYLVLKEVSEILLKATSDLEKFQIYTSKE